MRAAVLALCERNRPWEAAPRCDLPGGRPAVRRGLPSAETLPLKRTRAPSALPLVALVLVACGSAIERAAAEEQPGRQVARIHYDPSDRETGRFQYVPFEVSEGTSRLSIECRYAPADGANLVDLGLFEPGPLDLGTKGFRGWSEAGRSQISVGVADATPGYWPGPLPAGRWHVMLGLDKIGVSGVDVEVSVETSREPAAVASPLPSAPEAVVRRGPAWWSGALNAHTVHSDGALTAKELARKAREEGLDFLAITDHNNTAHQVETLDAPDLLHIVGEEVTTPGGDASVWGLAGSRDYVDFRVPAGDPALEDLVAAVRARGALFSINHPRAECLECSWRHSVPAGVVGIEIWNGTREVQQADVAIWDTLLLLGRQITGIGSSDWHGGELPLGSPSVRVWAAELSVHAILAGIRSGRVVVMADARTPPPAVTARAGEAVAGIGDTLSVRLGERYAVEVAADAASYEGARAELVWNGRAMGAMPVAADQPARFERKASQVGYLRIHVHASDGSTVAITNPIYVRIAER